MALKFEKRECDDVFNKIHIITNNTKKLVHMIFFNLITNE